MEPLNKLSYINQLDGVRFIAVSMVLLSHWVQIHIDHPLILEIPFNHGVILFFVISGYLISRSLMFQKSKSIDFKKIIKTFYIRRVLRIFPIYYLLILILFIVDFEQTRELIGWISTYTINIYQSITNEALGSLNHLWSLSVEEQFYLFWPFLLLRIKKKYTIHLISVSIIFSILFKIYLYIYVGNWMATSYFTISCMHALALGALIAYFELYNQTILKALNRTLWIIVLAIIYSIIIATFINSQFEFFKAVFDEFLFALLSFFVVIKVSQGGFKGWIKLILEFKPIKYLGKISYGIYLYHLIIPVLAKYALEQMEIKVESKPLLFLIYLSTTFLVSILSWELIELPINNLKKKFSYSTNTELNRSN